MAFAPTEAVITADDGIRLRASVYTAESARGVVQVNGAMAVHRKLYDPLCSWLALNGFHAVSFSYRGMEDSDAPRAGDRLQHWGEQDIDAVIDWCGRRWPQLPLAAIAHSVGGQLTGLSPRAAKLDAIVTVGAQSGYWKLYDGMMRLKVALAWHLAAPLFGQLLGRFPGWVLGPSSLDIPDAIASQWAWWGRQPGYLMDDPRIPAAERFARVECPLLGVSVGDDELAPQAAHDRMLDWYSNARVTRLRLHPRDFRLDRIGHFGLFRDEPGRSIFWPQLRDWLDESLPQQQEDD